jgi:hypothetical protein
MILTQNCCRSALEDLLTPNESPRNTLGEKKSIHTYMVAIAIRGIHLD